MMQKKRQSYPQAQSALPHPSPVSGMSRKKRGCPLKARGEKDIDYKDIELLKQFTTERGKIIPRRISGVSAYFQRKLNLAIKRARHMALMPFVTQDY